MSSQSLSQLQEENAALLARVADPGEGQPLDRGDRVVEHRRVQNYQVCIHADDIVVLNRDDDGTLTSCPVELATISRPGTLRS